MAKKQNSDNKKQDDIVGFVIEKLKNEIEAQQDQLSLIDEAKSFLGEIKARVTKAKGAVDALVEYMTPEQVAKVEEILASETTTSRSSSGGARTLNKVAQTAIEILQNVKDGQLTNGTLYDRYKLQAGDNAESYSQFNIKMRSLFNSQKLIKEVPDGDEGKQSRNHIVRINGFTPEK